jgi:hypothetical protein
LPNLLTYLWENPKLVATLLSNSNITDVKEHLASLIVNNFYENILSSNYIEDNLMYVLSLMIKEEINKLENVNQPETFLDNSSCGFLLYELRRKNDVQYFFKSVLLSVIDQLEASSFKKINLNIEEIIKTVDNSNKNNDSTDKKKVKTINPDDLYKKQLDYPNDLSANYEEMKIRKSEKLIFDEFTEKYLGNLTLNEIKKMIEENRDKEPIMNDYYNNQLINCDNTNENYYSN